jgi:hypothetical protein
MRVAFCPSPPLLVPEVGVGADPELDKLRTCCREAVASLVADAPAAVVVLGGGDSGGDEEAGGTFAPWGVDRRVGGPLTTLGLAHSVGAWLLDEVQWQGARRYVVPGELDALPEGTALLVVADGSATRTPKAPGSYDPDGEAFDATVGAALVSGDPGLLERLDAGPQLLVQGLEAWHEAGRLLAGGAYRGEVLADLAPFGVGYLVAVWNDR